MSPDTVFYAVFIVFTCVSLFITVSFSIRGYCKAKKRWPTLFADTTYRQWLLHDDGMGLIFYFILLLIPCIIFSGVVGSIAKSYIKEKIAAEHRLEPCELCRYVKIENRWIDRNGIEHCDEKLVWKSCPTLKK